MSEPFIAEVRMWACNFAPRGWSFCDGQLLPIAQNTALFSLIGTTYGGDGRTTCALPDLADRIPMHPGYGPGLTQRRLGEHIGSDNITLSQAQIPVHDHILKGVAQKGTSASPDNNLYMGQESTSGKENTFYLSTDSSTNTDLSAATLSDTGGNKPHGNSQPYSGINFCIALVGIYPSRN